jgi:hypothetical protein
MGFLIFLAVFFGVALVLGVLAAPFAWLADRFTGRRGP